MYVLDSCELVSLACVLFIRMLVVEFPMILWLTANGIHSDLSSLYVCIWYATIHWSTINTWAMRFFFAFMLQEFDSIFKERFSIERTLIVDDYILKPRWESSKFNIFGLHSHFECFMLSLSHMKIKQAYDVDDDGSCFNGQLPKVLQ